MKKSDAKHKSNQGNRNNPAHQRVLDNLANQKNHEHPAYASSRGPVQGKRKEK